MSTQTQEIETNSTQIDETLPQNLNNLTLNDSSKPTPSGWGWDEDEFDAKSEENKSYNETTNLNWGWGADDQKVEDDNVVSFPIRNGVPDCSFYLKTGSCKFGLNCRFNHPANVTRDKAKYRREQGNYQSGELNGNSPSSVMFGQTNAEKTYNEKKWGVSSESNGQIDCKYYSTPGGCKYGSACKFVHREKNDHPTELNFVGLPVRPGEKECTYYMNTGSCKYSTNCRYHHPEPTAVDAQAPLGVQNGRNIQHYSSPTPQNGGLRQPYHQPYTLQDDQKGRPQQPYALPAHQNGGTQQPYALPPHQTVGPQQSYGPPAQMPVAPWSLHRNPNEAVPYVNTSPSYASTGYYIPQQGVQSNPQWNGYQAPVNQMHSTEMNKPHPPTSYQMNDFAPSMGHSSEYPERPGQQECQYFMKTGDCKFKAACRYHHPKHRQPISEVILSPAGLPLRHDQPVCVHFSRHGICKFGRNCRYHHPTDRSPPVAYGSENGSFSYSDGVKNETRNGQAQESRW